jgi:hypothetical protein
MLTQPQLREALAAMVASATGTDEADWARWATWLTERQGRELLQLDDMARRYSPQYAVTVSGTRSWLGPEMADPSGFVATVTSWHADGRIRERATVFLAGSPMPLRASALALRSLDHVLEIREVALLGLIRQTQSTDQLDAVMRVLVAARRRGNAGSALDAYLTQHRLVHSGPEALRPLIRSADRRVRRWAYEELHRAELLSTDDLVAGCRSEPDQLVRVNCARWLGEQATPELLASLLSARFADGRMVAAQHLADDLLDDQALELLLLDPSARVRELACWRARRRGKDLRSFYVGRLQQDQRLRRETVACLEGVAEHGHRADLEDVHVLVGSKGPSVRASALSVLTKLEDPSLVIPLLARSLHDPSPRVAAVAARGLISHGGGVREALEAWESDQSWTRRAVWRLHRSAGTWERVEADARAGADEDPNLSALGLDGLRNWLNASAATAWGAPTPEMQERIARDLERCPLSVAEHRRLAFHAGLTFEEPAIASMATADPQKWPRLRFFRRG